MLAKLKIVSPQLSEEEKREPMDDPKLGQNLKDRLDRIKKEFYANSQLKQKLPHFGEERDQELIDFVEVVERH